MVTFAVAVFGVVGSGWSAVAVAVLATVAPPGGAVAGRTTSVRVAVLPLANAGRVQRTVPVLPTDGVVHDQPAGATSDWNVALAGTGSCTTTLVAVASPRLV